MGSETDLSLLTVAVAQAADLLERVDEGELGEPTPCRDWTVGDLVDHLVNAPVNFTTMMRGQQPDWGAPPEHVGADRAQRFRDAGGGLLDAWRASDAASAQSPLDWQLAELAVHTWDLATALGLPTGHFDPGVAERGLGFMRQGLTADNRAPVFAPEQPAPPDADAYTRIAAFAGREV